MCSVHMTLWESKDKIEIYLSTVVVRKIDGSSYSLIYAYISLVAASTLSPRKHTWQRTWLAVSITKTSAYITYLIFTLIFFTPSVALSTS